MKAACIYTTMTGHSKKIADAISLATGIPMYDVKKSKSAHIGTVDTLFIVGGIYGGKSMPELVHYVKKLDPASIKKAVLITSSMGKDKALPEVKAALAERNIELSSEDYKCQGSFLFFGLGHPSKQEIDGAVEFVKKHM